MLYTDLEQCCDRIGGHTPVRIGDEIFKVHIASSYASGMQQSEGSEGASGREFQCWLG
jgi:hypothetical protein